MAASAARSGMNVADTSKRRECVVGLKIRNQGAASVFVDAATVIDNRAPRGCSDKVVLSSVRRLLRKQTSWHALAELLLRDGLMLQQGSEATDRLNGVLSQQCDAARFKLTGSNARHWPGQADRDR